jgi:hypothetical protein
MIDAFSNNKGRSYLDIKILTPSKQYLLDGFENSQIFKFISL